MNIEYLSTWYEFSKRKFHPPSICSSINEKNLEKMPLRMKNMNFYDTIEYSIEIYSKSN